MVGFFWLQVWHFSFGIPLKYPTLSFAPSLYVDDNKNSLTQPSYPNATITTHAICILCVSYGNLCEVSLYSLQTHAFHISIGIYGALYILEGIEASYIVVSSVINFGRVKSILNENIDIWKSFA